MGRGPLHCVNRCGPDRMTAVEGAGRQCLFQLWSGVRVLADKQWRGVRVLADKQWRGVRVLADKQWRGVRVLADKQWRGVRVLADDACSTVHGTKE